MMTTTNRIYLFGDKNVFVANGGYLDPERIAHYEFCFGPLKSVTYKGNTVLTLNEKIKNTNIS